MKSSLIYFAAALFIMLSLPACSKSPVPETNKANSMSQLGNDNTAVQMVAANTTEAKKQPNSSRALVVYFSYSGNTKRVAEEIAKQTGADLFRLETIKAYPANYQACTDQAKKEKNSGERPQFKGSMPDISKYDTIYIGYPCWWYTCPMVVLSFVEKVDLVGKTIAPFSTHGGSGMTGIRDIQKAAPKASVTEGLAIYYHDLDSASTKVASWLKQITK
ncbi:MAG: flavodoxin [Candidatus Bruticola sp.]